MSTGERGGSATFRPADDCFCHGATSASPPMTAKSKTPATAFFTTIDVVASTFLPVSLAGAALREPSAGGALTSSDERGDGGSGVGAGGGAAGGASDDVDGDVTAKRARSCSVVVDDMDDFFVGAGDAKDEGSDGDADG
jgi:hypothetical protein